jgi:SAM-dependent methyltransferase
LTFEGHLVEYMNCSTCGTSQIVPFPSPQEVSTFYRHDYYGCGGSKFVGGVDAIRNLFIRRRAAKVAAMCGGGTSALLDVGCGSGTFLHCVSQLGIRGFGTELDGPAYERAKRIPGVSVQAAELSDDLFPGMAFDAVTIWHVLEHMWDPASILQAASGRLKAGGVLIVEVPRPESLQGVMTGKHWLHLDPPRHLYQFTDRAMRAMLADAGLSIESVETGAFEMGAMGILQGVLNRVIRPRDLLYNMLSTRNKCPGPLLGKSASVVLAMLLAPVCGVFAAAEMLCGGGVILRYVCRKPASSRPIALSAG